MTDGGQFQGFAPVSPAITAIKAEMEAMTRQERVQYGQAPTDDSSGQGQELEKGDSLPDIMPLDVLFCLETIPPKKEFIIDGYVPAGVCGLLIGTGGAGKSFLSLLMAMAIASGRTIEPFTVQESRAVLVVNVEEDQDDLHRRMNKVCAEYNFSQTEKDLMAKNLIIFPARGIIGPLMELDRQNPRPSISAEWLKREIDRYNPGLVMLDTKSRLYGLDENNNDHGAQWLGLLESMLVDHPATSIMIVTHTSKVNATNGDHHSNRGASSVGDNCRFGMAVTWLDEKEGKALRLKDHQVHIKLTHTKYSHSKQLETAVFRKNDFGVPVMIDTAGARSAALSEALDMLVEILRQDHPEGINKRDLEKVSTPECKTIRDDVVDACDIPKGDWPKVIAYGIESARLEPAEDITSSAKNKPVIIRVRGGAVPVRPVDHAEQTNWFELVKS